MMRRPILLIPILLVILAVSMFLALGIGVSGFSLFTFESEMIQKLLFEVRLPRIIAAVLVGAGLAAAGCAMQGLFRNPMADPYLLGTSSGGALGAAISIVFLGGLFMPVFTLVSALVCALALLGA